MMGKKKFLLYVALLMVCAVVSGCVSGEKIQLPQEISQVKVAYLGGGRAAEWELDQGEISQWNSWLNSLTLEPKTFLQNEQPGENQEGGVIYSFQINGEREESISYRNFGDCYLVIEDNWYQVLNPQDPWEPESLERYMEGANQITDLRPMLLVEEVLYLDTGKEMEVPQDAPSAGRIASSVERWEKPTQEGQSNFGMVGNSYCQQGEDLAVNMGGKWILFEREKPETLE